MELKPTINEKGEKTHRSPTTLNYLVMLKRFLKSTGTWPAEIFGDHVPIIVKINRETLPYHTFYIVVGALHYLHTNMDRLSFLDMGEMLLIALLSVLVSMDKKIEKLSIFYTNFMMVLMILAMSTFNIFPFYRNVKNAIFLKTENYTLEFSLYLSYPWFKPLNHFTFATIYNCYLSYNCGIMISGLDLILFLLIFQVIGHLKVLTHTLEHFPMPKKKTVLQLCDYKSGLEGSCVEEMYDDEENEEVRIKLMECVDHHRFIVAFIDQISDLYGPFIACNYMFDMAGCCLLLLECTGGEGAMLRYGPLTFVIFGQLIQISTMFEIMGSMAEKLKDASYMVPWECMNTSNRRTAYIMMHKMQNKIGLKAMGLTEVGVNTMTGILKTTFSYYAFLQTMN